MKIKTTVVLVATLATAFALYAAEGQKPSTHQQSAQTRQGICDAVPYCTTGRFNDQCNPCGTTSCDCSDGYQNWPENFTKYCNP